METSRGFEPNLVERDGAAGHRRSLATQGMSRGNWLEQLRRGGLDLAILLAVADGPRCGLAIIQHLEAFTDLVVGEGTIYPILDG